MLPTLPALPKKLCDFPSNAYKTIMPPFIHQQIKGIFNEIVSISKAPFFGFEDNRYKGNKDHFLPDLNADDVNFLKSRSIFVSQNPWDFALSMAFFSVITTVGFLLSSGMTFPLGLAMFSIGSALGIGYVQEVSSGDKMKAALEIILKRRLEASQQTEGSSRSQIKNIDLAMNTKSFTLSNDEGDWKVAQGLDAKTHKVVMYLFKETVIKKETQKTETVIKAYYFGNRYSKLQSEGSTLIDTPTQKTTVLFKRLLEGTEIADLIQIARG
jgi:hypothetical protein